MLYRDNLKNENYDQDCLFILPSCQPLISVSGSSSSHLSLISKIFAELCGTQNNELCPHTYLQTFPSPFGTERLIEIQSCLDENDNKKQFIKKLFALIFPSSFCIISLLPFITKLLKRVVYRISTSNSLFLFSQNDFHKACHNKPSAFHGLNVICHYHLTKLTALILLS